MVPKFIPSANPQIMDAVGALIKRPSAERTLLCMEDALGRRRDFELAPQHWARQVFFCGDDVYDFAREDGPLNEAIRMLGGAEWRPDIGLVTSLPAELEAIKQGDEVSTAQLREMADTAVAVILGAWDDDSLLFWEPGRSHPRAA